MEFTELGELLLRPLGWTPERRIDPTPWLDFLVGEGFPIFDHVIAILSSVGGLDADTIRSPESPDSPRLRLGDDTVIVRHHMEFNFLPDLAPHAYAEIIDEMQSNGLVRRERLMLCPIGAYNTFTTMFVANDGRIFRGEIYNHIPAPHPSAEQFSLRLLGRDLRETIHRFGNTSVIYL